MFNLTFNGFGNILIIISVIILVIIIIYCYVRYKSLDRGIKTDLKTLESLKKKRDDYLFQYFWLKHVEFTREYIIRTVNHLPDINNIKGKLLDNQKNLAKNMEAIYPNSYTVMEKILTEHVEIIEELLKCVAENKNIRKIKKKLQDNIEEIVTNLHNLNSKYDLDILKKYMKEYLDTTNKEIELILNGKSATKEYDSVSNNMMEFSSYLLSN